MNLSLVSGPRPVLPVPFPVRLVRFSRSRDRCHANRACGPLESGARRAHTRAIYRLAGIVAAATVAFAAAVGLSSAAPPAPATQIAYIGKIPKLKTYALYTINTDGSGRQLLTPRGRVSPYSTLSWSPDGKQIAYARGELNQIVVRDLEPSAVKQLTSAHFASSDPSFSPDGKLIAFDRDTNDYRQVWVMNADGSEKRQLTNSRQFNEWPAWSPDGTKIIFERYYKGSRMEIWTMDIDGTQKQKIARVKTFTAPNGGWWCACPVFSPDGTKIAYEAITEQHKSSIYVMNADGSGRTRLTFRSSTREENPDWSPDGKQLAFQSERFGNAEIVVMDADGTHQRRITHDPWYDCCPRWKPVPPAPPPT